MVLSCRLKLIYFTLLTELLKSIILNLDFIKNSSNLCKTKKSGTPFQKRLNILVSRLTPCVAARLAPDTLNLCKHLKQF